MSVPLIMQILLDQLKRHHVGIQLWRYGEEENTLRVKQQLVVNYSATSTTLPRYFMGIG